MRPNDRWLEHARARSLDERVDADEIRAIYNRNW
jgi:hypothetical protein